MILSNFLWANAAETSHTILSSKVSGAQREKILLKLQAMRANSLNVYLLNEGDYSGQSVCPYAKNKWFEPALDLARLAEWEAILSCCVAMGLHPILWLAADDSPTIADAWKHRRQAVANIIIYLARRFDRYALAWCLGLEVNEWCRDKSLADFYGSILAASVKHPCGIHQTTGRWDYAAAPWCYFHMLQYGFGKDQHTAAPADVIKMSRACVQALRKPVIAFEYSRYGDSARARAAGQAALTVPGIVGVCNGF